MFVTFILSVTNEVTLYESRVTVLNTLLYTESRIDILPSPLVCEVLDIKYTKRVRYRYPDTLWCINKISKIR